MIQDIAPNHFRNEYEKKAPKATDQILCYDQKNIYAADMDGNLTFLTYKQVEMICLEKQMKLPEMVYLFSIGSINYFLTDQIFGEVEGFSFIKMHDIRKLKPKEQVMAAATGWHLYHWYETSQFCGKCGQKMQHDEKERMMRCTHCGNLVFPRLVPAVIVGVKDKDKILLTKYAGREYTRYALIAGFTEIGETLEETVKREVLEEVGLHVKNVTYYKSQPWGFDSDLLMGFFCELDDTKEIVMDENELSVAEWVSYKEVPLYQEGLSLTEEMMHYFVQEKRKAENK